MFITLEGGEGVGKSTQIARLVARIRAAGHDVLATREPGGAPTAEIVRTLILSGAAAALGPAAEAVLFSAARIDHLDHTIRPALARGALVVCDRFADSTAAYQGAAGDVGPVLIAALRRVVVGTTEPDLTLVLDAPAAVGLARADARRAADAPDRFERLDLAFHDRLREAFVAIAKAEPARCVPIDATQAVDDVTAAIWAVVAARLPPLRSGR